MIVNLNAKTHDGFTDEELWDIANAKKNKWHNMYLFFYSKNLITVETLFECLGLNHEEELKKRNRNYEI